MERSREQSFCCGGGGGMCFVDEQPDQRVNQERADEAIATGADVVAVGCPFCTTMLEDGVAARKGDRDVVVRDVAELLWESVSAGQERSPRPTSPRPASGWRPGHRLRRSDQLRTTPVSRFVVAATYSPLTAGHTPGDSSARASGRSADRPGRGDDVAGRPRLFRRDGAALQLRACYWRVGAVSIHTHFDYSKTFSDRAVVPALRGRGPVALRLFRVARSRAPSLPSGPDRATPRRSERLTSGALLLVAFYPGTLRNVVAGLDDMPAQMSDLLARYCALP